VINHRLVMMQQRAAHPYGPVFGLWLSPAAVLLKSSHMSKRVMP
jgi:hypothetical protein